MKINAALRPARSQDMAACADIFSDWVEETAWMPRVHSREDVRRHYQNDLFGSRKIYVVASGSKIAGMMVLDEAEKTVSSLYAARPFRQQGVGKLLLDRAKADLGARVQLWTFQANAAARRFYAREGFAEINCTDGDNEEGLPDVLMEWRA